jgi:hypothetical protein
MLILMPTILLPGKVEMKQGENNIDNKNNCLGQW